MSDIAGTGRPQRAMALLNFLFLLAAMVVIARILTTAMTLQYVWGELPCPLCLLERLALFGVCFGIMQSLRKGFSDQNTGISLLFALLLLLIATRQTLLDIYPRPGHAYIGSAVLGLHMPVWSIVIAFAILTAYAFKLAVLGADRSLRNVDAGRYPLLTRIAAVVGLYVIVLCAINFVSVILQCGFGECHTEAYRLLQ